MCSGFRDDDQRLMSEYLLHINNEMNELKNNEDEDVTDVFPMESMLEDVEFLNYVKNSNTTFVDAIFVYFFFVYVSVMGFKPATFNSVNFKCRH